MTRVPSLLLMAIAFVISVSGQSQASSSHSAPTRRRHPVPPRRRHPSPSRRRAPPQPPPFRLGCKAAATGLEVFWSDPNTHDYYEVHLASSEHGRAFGAMSTSKTHVLIQEVLKGHTYWVKIRSHAPGHTLDHGWNDFSNSIECKVPKMIGSNRSFLDDIELGAGDGYEFQVVREAHGNYVDYLQEHNSANFAGEVSFLKGHAHAPISQLSLYCVHIVNKHIPGGATTGGDSRFANYASCQIKGHPVYECHKINDEDCKWLHLSADQCKKARTSESWEYTSKYVGKGYRKSTSLGYYHLYSFPNKTECTAGLNLGDHGCTWKREPFFRMAVGKTGMTLDEMTKAFHNVPLDPKSCGGHSRHSSVTQELLV